MTTNELKVELTRLLAALNDVLSYINDLEERITKPVADSIYSGPDWLGVL